MINQLNKHFIHAGSVFDSLNANATVPCSVITPATGNLDVSVSVNQICKALKGIDNKTSVGPDNLDPYHIFNLSLLSNSLTKIWKAAYVLPLFKGGDPSDMNNYRLISKLSILAKILQSQVNLQLKQFSFDINILNSFQSGFRTGHSTITAATVVLNYIIGALDKKTALRSLICGSV